MRQARKQSIQFPINHSRLPLNTTSAQELLQGASAVEKAGFLQYKTKLGTWKRRFIVLTADRISFYEKETSDSPRRVVHLLGYNGVRRCVSKSAKAPWPFEILRASFQIKSQIPMKFSCVNDEERYNWMTAIKNSLYSANLIDRPTTGLEDEVEAILRLSDKRKRVASLESAYPELEELVFMSGARSNDREEPANNAADHTSSDEEDDDDETFIHEVHHLGGSQRKVVSPPPPGTVLKEDHVDAPRARRRSVDSRPKLTSLPPSFSMSLDSPHLLPQHPTSSMDRDISNLESLCLAVDSGLTRDELIENLKAKPKGTYLIRNSRSRDLKVLSCHFGEGKVGEFIIHERTDGNVSIDIVNHFDSVNELLKAYTVQMPLPSTNQFLFLGISSFGQSTVEEEEDERIYSELTHPFGVDELL